MSRTSLFDQIVKQALSIDLVDSFWLISHFSRETPCDEIISELKELFQQKRGQLQDLQAQEWRNAVGRMSWQ